MHQQSLPSKTGLHCNRGISNHQFQSEGFSVWTRRVASGPNRKSLILEIESPSRIVWYSSQLTFDTVCIDKVHYKRVSK